MTGHAGMTRKFRVTMTRDGNDYIASCPDLPGAVARGSSANDALEKIKAVITKILEDGSDDGTAPKPHPVSPSPRGPIIVEESHERPDGN